MASLLLPVVPPKPKPKPKPNPKSFHNCNSFLPPNTISLKIKNTRTAKSSIPPLTIANSFSSSPPKIVRCPSLDRHASSHSRLRFVRKLTTLLLSKPRHFLPIRILSRCRPYLSLPPGRPLLPMIHRYPSIFRLLRTPSFSSPSSLSLLSVALTPAADSLFSSLSALRLRISSALADKLHRLLMLSSHRRLLLSKLVHIAPDLGLSPNFRSRICNAHPHRFRTIDTSYGRALELLAWNDDLAVAAGTFLPPPVVTPPLIIDRPLKFKKVSLRKGLNVKRKHLDYLIRFQEMPEVNPYLRGVEEGMSAEEKEKRACAVVREVLGMTVEKRTLVDHLTHFRKEFGLPNKLRAMLIRHPEMFYVSIKGQRDSVFLVEAYDDKGRLLVEDELLEEKKRLEELVREGKRMRRERRRGVDLIGDEKEKDDEEVDEEYYEDDDALGDLFESGIGEDWEDFGDGDGRVDDYYDKEGNENVEFWSLKSGGGSSGCPGLEERAEAW